MMTRLLTGLFQHPVKIWYQLLALISLGLLSGCNPNIETPLRIATIPWPGYESLHLAQSLNYFEGSSIRIIDMPNNSQAAMALHNGTVNAALLTLDETLTLMQDGLKLQVILVMDVSNGADVVMARPDITTLQALRGKRVAVDNAAVGAVMLDAMLQAANLKVDDIQLIPKTVNEHTYAYLKGQIDAAVTFEPVRSQLLKNGARILFDSSQIPGRIIDVLAVRTDAMDHHTQALKQLTAAHFKALAYLASNPEDAARRIAPYLNIKPGEVAAQYQGLMLPTLADNHRWLNDTPAKLNNTANELATLLQQRHLLQHAPRINNLAQPQFLPVNSP